MRGHAVDAQLVGHQPVGQEAYKVAGLEVHLRTGDVLGKDYFKAGAAA